jgi:hypothetical protein
MKGAPIRAVTRARYGQDWRCLHLPSGQMATVRFWTAFQKWPSPSFLAEPVPTGLLFPDRMTRSQPFLLVRLSRSVSYCTRVAMDAGGL